MRANGSMEKLRRELVLAQRNSSMRLAFEFRRCRSCAGKKIIGGNIFDLFASVPLFLTHVNRNVKPS